MTKISQNLSAAAVLSRDPGLEKFELPKSPKAREPEDLEKIPDPESCAYMDMLWNSTKPKKFIKKQEQKWKKQQRLLIKCLKKEERKELKELKERKKLRKQMREMRKAQKRKELLHEVENTPEFVTKPPSDYRGCTEYNRNMAFRMVCPIH